MNYYLSSFHLGNSADVLQKWCVGRKPLAIIMSAADFVEPLERAEKIKENIAELRSIGIESRELDLRGFFHHDKKEVYDAMKNYGGLFVRGGNTFLLRKAMKYSGLDLFIQEKARDTNDSEFVYAGYSAGVCVLAPTLRGLELVDPPHESAEGYGDEVLWDGLGLVEYLVAPHYQSEHPEAGMVDLSVKYFQDHKMPFKTLRDGEVILFSR
ncbi:MAG: Peptidase E [Microgenomates group bacterium GW2011_GWF2_45_18]|nr:MAG: Peptidase E [Microgenomates group bacterium GW2011_GWF1_44_10]KKU01695.1 MAG: Peptidase E [Microgenomates group bacterium GW2011_GWF2_45_18]OGJ41534.1 MAG: hypothetical protein A2378_00350 [Candidatus Pacebacteria bacterium RIFOXYB1_FULL_44_10]HAU99550.1 hypothetical protein [Candidatus Paceibacterota bacterium]HAX01474.1 hypothetical protein [Candidatus Paceibacterota bacterium]